MTINSENQCSHQIKPTYFVTRNVLHHAAKKGYLDMVQYLVDKGIPVDSQENHGR